MKTERADITNFQGKLVVLGKYSNKPKQNIAKTSAELEKLIRPKDWNLYLEQDYGNNNVKMTCDSFYPFENNKDGIAQVNVPITSKASKYISAAQDALDMYEKVLYDKEQKEWENNKKRQIKEDIKSFAGLAALYPLFIVNDILYYINPKWSEKFEQILDEI